jgi:hypothetical protein
LLELFEHVRGHAADHHAVDERHERDPGAR